MSMNTGDPGLERGERAPDFALPLQDGTPTRFYSRAGGCPVVLLLFDPVRAAELAKLAEVLLEAGTAAPEVLAVVGKAGNGAIPHLADLPFPVFTDVAGAVKKGFRLTPDDEAIACVLDANLRVLRSLPVRDLETAAGEIGAALASDASQVAAREIERPAPILVVPRVLTGDDCQQVIEIWGKENRETGVEQSLVGQREEVISHDNKSRRDHVVTGDDLLRSLTSKVGRRVIPEIRQAFAFKATRFEGFKIVRYDAEEGGLFHAHRDNLSPATAHRRFGLTVNLNEGYEGGHIRFPEYGPNLYRPHAGAALLFSCALLHEVTPVTEGSRFALLSFIFGEEEARSTPTPR